MRSLTWKVTALAGLTCIQSATAEVAKHDEWLPVPAQTLQIESGSPIDFSGFTPDRPAGSSGWLKAEPNGVLRFESDPSPVRFGCATEMNGPHITSPFPAHEESELYATQIKRHGYNLVRFHNVDFRLMAHRSGDFDFDQENLDRFLYLLGALKRHGIYWGIDLMTSQYGALAHADERPKSADSIKIRVNFDPDARSHWLEIVKALYEKRNPYTGMSTLEDPALAFVIPVNENSIAFWSISSKSRTQPFPADLATYFNDWLAQRYRSSDALRAALPELGDDERVETRTIHLPGSWSETGARIRIFFDFLSSKEIETYDWMTNALKARGFNGIALAYHDFYPQNNNATRVHLPVIDVHGYVGREGELHAASQWDLYSSLSNDIRDYLSLFSARWLRKPFTITEYGQFFWSPFRYESGILMPSIAAFQGASLICRTAHASIEPDIRRPGQQRFPMLPLSVGLDPIARAGETLAALLFVRGDVASAARSVAILFGTRDLQRLGSAILSKELTRTALLSSIGLVTENEAVTAPTETLLLPLSAYSAQSNRAQLADRLVAKLSGSSEERMRAIVSALRANGTLSPTNVTDPAHRLYQSSTGELLYQGEAGVFSVCTPKTEAAAITYSEPVKLSVLEIAKHSPRILVSASALDGEPLVRSRRILLILAGDAVNTHMIFSPTAANTIVSWGQLPILMRRVSAEVKLAMEPRRRAHFTVLGLDGAVTRRNDLSPAREGTIEVTLDSGAVPDRPTTFFLVESD